MKKITVYLPALITSMTLLFFTAGLAAQNNKKVIMILSGHGQQQGQEAPGYEFDEFAKAYLILKAHSVDVDLASPQGGAIEADKYDPKKPYNEQVLNDSAIMTKLSNTLAIRSLKGSDYDGIFIVGGKGAMFDLPKDTALQNLIADIYQQQGSVAAVCHGPAALVDVKLADGSYLVANKAVNGFTNQEEQLFGKKWMPKFDFMLEDRLVERGGKFQSSEIMLSHVAVDERLITGQNPSSTVDVAQELVKSLGIKPVNMVEFRDDKTLNLVAQILAGNSQAKIALSNNSDQYHMELVGMYGFYYMKTADNDKELYNALTLMTLGQKAINNPSLDIKIASVESKLGDVDAARKTLNRILASNPDFEPAQDMLKSLSL